ncbi:MAG: trypsin-like peptidase domain-containing protein [Planctomycetia bacterium]|nr:trypsin-like peptidase domain-containing protein [Planctomycetia bacterium]
MSLTIRFQGGQRAGEVLTFDDAQERLTIGRDAAHCQVVFPADEVKVGREHCALVRELGRYRLILNHDNLVLINGKPALDGQELGAAADLQMGPDGPKLIVETTHGHELPSTSFQGNRPGQATMVQAAGHTAQTGKRVALTAVVLLAVAGVIGYAALHSTDAEVAKTKDDVAKAQDDVAKTQEDVAKAKEDVAKTKETVSTVQADVEQIKPKVTALNKLTDDQKTMLEGITSKVAEVEKRMKDDAPRLGAILKKVAPSVYLVLLRDPDGQEYAEATAWVVDQKKGIMATNGHVAALFPGADSKQKLVVRSNVAPYKTYVVKSTVTHPGYAAFSKLWRDYDPAQRKNPLTAEVVGSAGPACDVALLYLESYADLADALPLAPNDVLAGMGPAYAVGYVGYPMEGMALGGINKAAPTPVQHMAYISSVTSYFGDANSPFEDRQLVQHALPCTGGASGSPIVNRDGQVIGVLNAGTVIGATRSARLASSVNISFGQRADLVREMLDGKAHIRQIVREKHWRDDISKYFQHRDVVVKQVENIRDQFANRTFAGWQTGQAGNGDYEIERVKLVDTVVNAHPQAVAAAKLTQNGPCLVIAYDTSTDYDISLRVQQTEELTTISANANDTNFSWAKALAFEGHEKADLKFIVGTEGGENAISIKAIQIQRKRIAPKVRLEKLLSDWKDTVTRRRFSVVTPTLVSESTGKLPAPLSEGQLCVNRVELPLNDTGDYFLFVSTAGDDKLGLVAAPAGEPARRLISELTGAPTASGSFQATEKMTVVALILGPKKDTEYELKLYRAVPQ